MKTLKPKEQESSTIIPRDYLQGIQAVVNQLNTQISSLNNRLEELQNELDSTTINKQSGYITNVISTRTTTHELDADIGEIDDLESDVISSNGITSTNGNVENFTFGNAVGESATITSLTTDAITTDEVNGESATFDNITITDTTSTENLNATNASISNLQIDSLQIPNLNAQNSITAVEVNASELNAQEAQIDNASISNVETTGAVIDQLKNSKKVFDKSKFILTSTSNNDPFYIKVPAFTSGSYRVELRDSNDVFQFSAVFINSKDAPILTYTKANESALTNVYYNGTDYYLESYLLNGKLYWSADTFETVESPSTYTEFTSTGYSIYSTSADKRVVILGNSTAYYGLDVQGALKAAIFIDNSTEGTPLFYTGDATGLISQLNSYLPDEGSISVAGYVYDLVEEKQYSIQTITRDEDTKLWCYVETRDGTGTDVFELTTSTPYKFGLFTTTFDWDRSVN